MSIVLLILLILVFLLLILLTFVWPPDSPWSPWWRTNNNVAQGVIELAQITSNDKVFELGSGDGGSVAYFAQKTGAQCTGIEIEPTRFLISKIRRYFSPKKDKIKFTRQDFKKTNLTCATVIYIYLVPAGMKRLVPQFTKQLKKGTRVVSYTYKIPLSKNEKKLLLVKEDDKNKLFLYKIS